MIDNILYHVPGKLHIVVKVGKSDFGFYHPEFSGMTCRIGIFSAESRTESINFPERHCVCFARQLSRHRKIGGLSEKVLGVVHFSVFVPGRIFGIYGCHAEHLARSFAVGSGNYGRMDIHETATVEKRMYCESNLAAHAEHRGKQIGTRS